MTNRPFTCGIVLAACALATSNARAAAPPPSDDVLDGIKAVDSPTGSFLPKYVPELFAGVGYAGTFSAASHQWPTFVLSPLEGLLARPGEFDIGAYSELRLGRPDEQFGRFEVGLGLEVMWRFVESSFYDVAALVRGAYLIDTSDPNRPLLRPGVGAQLSLLRSLALQVTYDELYSTSGDFSNGHGMLHGLSVTVKVGLCPMADFCHQAPQHSIEKLDRSGITCQKAALTCQAAQSSASATAALCGAAARAMDTSKYPADWDDPAGAFLRALTAETAGIGAVIGAPLAELSRVHSLSVKGLKDYGALQRTLGDGQMLNKNYGYLVTPVMLRDWLGCAANGTALTCATDATCERDTGSAE